jgi:dTDP-4-amino-4,6-dideoxygalactose transaminase
MATDNKRKCQSEQEQVRPDKRMQSELAINGGPPILPEGPPSWPPADATIRDALMAAFAAGDWGRYHGPYVERLESCLASYHKVAHAMTCCSGTFAVELALRGLKIGDGDEVIVAGYDFSGNFRSIEAVGARPVLLDIDPSSSCLDVDTVRSAIQPATRAVIVSHLHSGIAPMAELCALADEADLRVVEDACQIPGGRVEGRVAGTWGDVGVLSFGGSKLLTAGRGGAIITSREDVYQRAKIFRERGNDAFPLSELQAAVLLPQLEELDAKNETRRANVERLLAGCSPLERLNSVNGMPQDSAASYYKVAWWFDEQGGTATRDEFITAMRAEGVAVDVGFRGFTRRGARRCRRVGALQHAARAADQTVLLHHPVLLEDAATIDRVTSAFQKIIGGLFNE